MNTEPNPYAPPKVPVHDIQRMPRVMPGTVKWAVTVLWVAFGITLTHALFMIGHRSRALPPGSGAINEIGVELFNAALIYGVSRGRYLARLIYGVMLGVRTLNLIQQAPADWKHSPGLVVMTVISFLCEYLAIFWLFAEPGRRWFMRSREPIPT